MSADTATYSGVGGQGGFAALGRAVGRAVGRAAPVVRTAPTAARGALFVPAARGAFTAAPTAALGAPFAPAASGALATAAARGATPEHAAPSANVAAANVAAAAEIAAAASRAAVEQRAAAWAAERRAYLDARDAAALAAAAATPAPPTGIPVNASTAAAQARHGAAIERRDAQLAAAAEAAAAEAAAPSAIVASTRAARGVPIGRTAVRGAPSGTRGYSSSAAAGSGGPTIVLGANGLPYRRSVANTAAGSGSPAGSGGPAAPLARRARRARAAPHPHASASSYDANILAALSTTNNLNSTRLLGLVGTGSDEPVARIPYQPPASGMAPAGSSDEILEKLWETLGIKTDSLSPEQFLTGYKNSIRHSTGGPLLKWRVGNFDANYNVANTSYPGWPEPAKELLAGLFTYHYSVSVTGLFQEVGQLNRDQLLSLIIAYNEFKRRLGQSRANGRRPRATGTSFLRFDLVRNVFFNYPGVYDALRTMGIPDLFFQVDHPFAIVLIVNLLDTLIRDYGTDSFNITLYIAIRDIIQRSLTAEFTHMNAWFNWFDSEQHRAGHLVNVRFAAQRINPFIIQDRLEQRLIFYQRLAREIMEQSQRLRIINPFLPEAPPNTGIRLTSIISNHPDYRRTETQLTEIDRVIRELSPSERDRLGQASVNGQIEVRSGQIGRVIRGQIGGNRTDDLIQYLKGVLMLYFGDSEFSFDKLNTYFITLPKNTNNYLPLPDSPRNNNTSTNNNSSPNSPLPNSPSNISEITNLSLTPLSSITVPEITREVTQKDIDNATLAMVLTKILINLEEKKFNADELFNFLELMGIEPGLTIEDVIQTSQISRLLYPDGATSEPQLRGGKSKKFKKTRKSSRLPKRRQTKRR
jgi:hypothetical protein